MEAHPQCERMRLGDMQAKPIQRITKYPLLLKAVLKTTQAPHTQHTLRGMVSEELSFSIKAFLFNLSGLRLIMFIRKGSCAFQRHFLTS